MGMNLQLSSSISGVMNGGQGGGVNLREQNIFGLKGAAWQDTANYYVPGTGNPAVSTDDYYHSSGVLAMRPYDLLQFGATGASIAASRGRYVWIFSPDHGTGGGSVWNGSFDYRIGYSNDPGVLPDRANFMYSIATQTALAQVATFTGTISGTTLTASSVTGVIMNDNHAQVVGAGITAGTYIVSQQTGTPGKAGTYTVSASHTVGPITMTAKVVNYGIYQDPQLIYNPDDATYPFYVYSEGSASAVQHETGVIRSSDLINWVGPDPTHGTLNFDSWSSYQQVNRNSTGNWESYGFQVGFPQNGNQWAVSKWTSTDGLSWEPASTTAGNVNIFYPSSARIGTSANSTGACISVQTLSAPYKINIAGTNWVTGAFSSQLNGVRTGSQWVGRYAVDANMNLLDTPAPVMISDPHSGVYPGPNYHQAVSSYYEDGILHYYSLRGWVVSNSLWGVVTNATYANGGGLWHQALDYYTEVLDASAAATAAPVGVKASCAGSTVTLNWYNCLPTNTYRVYRGSTAGSQTTLVGDFTGTSATDSGATGNAVNYYKVVYLNGGEQKSRVVSTYVSSSSQMVNAHMTRVLAAGADPATINKAWLDTFDAWLVSNGLQNNLMFATMAEFGVIKDGSNIISKIFDYGTTRLPRGGDYTTETTSTTYNATGINGHPAWMNTTNTARGYYGGDRSYCNNIRRKKQITAFTAYNKQSTFGIMFYVKNQFGARMYLSHENGNPGAINFALSDGTQQKIAVSNVSGSATGFHTATGVFDGSNLYAYADAVQGAAQTGLVIPSPSLSPSDGLTGQIGGSGLIELLCCGGDGGMYNPNIPALGNSGAQAAYDGAANIIFDIGLSQAQVTSLHNLIKTHYGL